jgi:hypothetical protein
MKKVQGLAVSKMLFALLGLGLLLATASAYAQTINLKADVPFNFVVTAGTLPNGEYAIQSVEGTAHAVAISGAGQKPSVFLANSCLTLKGGKPSHQSKLVFRRYGDQYFLSEIWVEGSIVGHQLPKSRREVEIAQNEMVQQVIVLAELR